MFCRGGKTIRSFLSFEDVTKSFPDRDRLERARRGFELARDRNELLKNLPEWRMNLKDAWPGAAFELRLDTDGLTLDVNNAVISDLSPLAGIPLTSLSCWGNRITDLEPLRGMPLVNLNCAANPIRSLAPLRDLPLLSLRCEHCEITTLEPLRETKLTVLNCAENRLKDELEPLRGVPLTWLACMKTGIKGLAPVRGMPLERLFCDANEIADLEPLRGLPLIEIACRGNRIESLDPLRGIPLNTIRCDSNRIRSLEPLRGMPLSTFSCADNLVESLDPLREMQLACLICGSNQYHDIGPFIKNPPKSFLFDSHSVSVRELEFVHGAWSRDFRYADALRAVEVLLAVRRSDGPKLRSLSKEFQGHRYLFIPKFASWTEAEALARSWGAHLVTILSPEENEFVASLFPFGGSWFWIGLNVTDKGYEWVTGEPFTYHSFPVL